jgi:hypothetical protein
VLEDHKTDFTFFSPVNSDRRFVKRATAFLLANGTRDFGFPSNSDFLWCELDKA